MNVSWKSLFKHRRPRSVAVFAVLPAFLAIGPLRLDVWKTRYFQMWWREMQLSTALGSWKTRWKFVRVKIQCRQIAAKHLVAVGEKYCDLVKLGWYYFCQN